MRIRTKLWATSFLGALGLAAACGDNEDQSGELGAAGDGQAGDATALGGEAGTGRGTNQGGSDPSVVPEAGSGGAPPLGHGRECLSPEFDARSGTVECTTRSGGQYTHRKAIGTGCNYDPPGAGGTGGDGGHGGAGLNEGGTCEPSACPGNHAYCEDRPWPLFGTQCADGCITDADCPSGRLCSCRGDGQPGECLLTSCFSDTDCRDGMRCISDLQRGCPDVPSNQVQFHCESPQDECTVAEDCAEPDVACDFDKAGYRVCEGAGGQCGRPFLVDGGARAASLVARGDWVSLERRPNVASLSEDERRMLGRHYARAGQLEHASIAAFARFSLQLLSLGAPPHLVDACTRAIADETRHARACFALASHYSGAELGPAPLPIDGCLSATSLEEIVELVIAEGCVGETVAALEAAEAAEHATDPVVAETLRAISADESRHAQLAYRFVAWALTQGGDLRELVAHSFTRHTRAVARGGCDHSASTAASGSPRLAEHGWLSPGQHAEIRQSALREAVAPCARALLSQAIEHNAVPDRRLSWFA
jgi:hypothetical protein